MIVDIDELKSDVTVSLQHLRDVQAELQFFVCGSGETIREVAKAIENGARDFILRPAPPEEFRMRIMQFSNSEPLRQLTRQNRASGFGPLHLDVVGGGFFLSGNYIELTPRERSVLQVLVRANGNIVSKDKIASRVFSFDDDADPRAIETYIHRLRRKARHPSLNIETVRGFGYRLRLVEDA